MRFSRTRRQTFFTSGVWPGVRQLYRGLDGDDFAEFDQPVAPPMSYDLGRLRLNALIERINGTNRDRLTADGQRVAIFYTKLHQRLLRPLLAADTPPAPPQLRAALATIDHHITGYTTAAGLGNAAQKLKINVKDRTTKLR